METEGIYSLTVTCAAGLEPLCADEIETAGGKVYEQARGILFWRGNLAAAYTMCLWSRFASRVILNIAEFDAPDENRLYKGCWKVDWQQHMTSQKTFAVDCTLTRSAMRHSRFAALRVKDAIADQFREKTGVRPSVKVERPDVRIRLHVHEDRATLGIDLSGESLHRRGYRSAGGGEAPLKESLAAAIVTLAGWSPDISPDTMFLDPMCGSGTLLVEAALIYGDSAPGLSRSYFGFTGWKGHDAELWSGIVNRAVTREEAGMEKPWPVFMGYDADPAMVAVARRNIDQAGLSDRISVKKSQLAFLKRPSARGFVITNPPYGERLLEKEESTRLYQAIGRILRTELHGWHAGIFASNPDMGHRMDIRWEQSHRLLNGPIKCRLFCGTVPVMEHDHFRWQINSPGPDTPAPAFANRLRKNLKKTLKWARKNHITCFRTYDRDIPEYNVAVDIYHKRVLVQEYAPPSSVDTNAATQRFQHVLCATREVLGVSRDRLFIKTRKRQKGKQQYQKRKGGQGRMYVVREGERFFLVNFTDYLDTGLFLDHRITRELIGKMAAGKRFLNLYAYTATATVHAAAGGAEFTTTVDLSSNYLAWARQNMALNGLGGPQHQFVKADCIDWLAHGNGEYDLIFVDPPTFSNNKKQGRIFDIQKDHVRLIDMAMKRLAPGGLLLFSCNFRKFRMAPEIEKRCQVKDITRATIPFDFQRNPRVHKCYEIRM